MFEPQDHENGKPLDVKMRRIPADGCYYGSYRNSGRLVTRGTLCSLIASGICLLAKWSSEALLSG